MGSPKILTVVGARPQFVKVAPVRRAMTAAGITEILVHTGQHWDPAMSDVFFDEFGINPDIVLSISGDGHRNKTGRMLGALEDVMLNTPCDAVLVYGDTDSTLAGALAAARLGIPLIHLEAGLRSFKRGMPEEVNRVVTDRLADLLLAPTRQALAHLAAEGLGSRAVHVGDVMLDAALQARVRAVREAEGGRDILRELRLKPGSHAVMTLHRAEATAVPERLSELIDACVEAAEGRPLVFPVHPRTRHVIDDAEMVLHESILQTGPLSYLDMTRLVSTAHVVLTDSGGLQKEAYFHRVPCVTLRSETEWPETVSCGWNRLWTQPEYAPRSDILDYGNGNAAETSVDAILAFLSTHANAAAPIALQPAGAYRARAAQPYFGWPSPPPHPGTRRAGDVEM